MHTVIKDVGSGPNLAKARLPNWVSLYLRRAVFKMFTVSWSRFPLSRSSREARRLSECSNSLITRVWEARSGEGFLQTEFGIQDSCLVRHVAPWNGGIVKCYEYNRSIACEVFILQYLLIYRKSIRRYKARHLWQINAWWNCLRGPMDPCKTTLARKRTLSRKPFWHAKTTGTFSSLMFCAILYVRFAALKYILRRQSRRRT